MSFVQRTKEFFGLDSSAYDYAEDDAYYEDHATEGNLAYAPRYGREDREIEDSYRTPQYRSTVVPVTVRSFNDATHVGGPFRDGDAVVMDIADLSREEGKRIIDFAAGLCFALRGQMKKLDSGIFAIIPAESRATLSDLERAAGL